LIPQKFIDLSNRLDLSILYEIQQWIKDLILERTKHLQADDLPKDREILNVKMAGSVTYRQEKISFGKNC
jgi:hypothetical protein